MARKPMAVRPVSRLKSFFGIGSDKGTSEPVALKTYKFLGNKVEGTDFRVLRYPNPAVGSPTMYVAAHDLTANEHSCEQRTKWSQCSETV